MLTFWGESHPHCDGVSRRNFLALGALGVGGLTLGDVLRARAAAPAGGRTGKAKAAILVYLPGGPSHVDSYDPKPDAPAEFRGEFSAIPTNVPGVRLSELLPRQASMMDKLAVVRSVASVDEHSDSYVMTGYPERENKLTGHPSLGAVVSKLRPNSGDLPPFVSLRGMSIGTEPGYLGVAHRPFTPDGPGLNNLTLSGAVTAPRLAARQDLLEAFDTARRDADSTGAMAGMDQFSRRAFDMIASGAVRKALDLRNEDAATREKYKGVEKFLLARRLVEAGVGCVTLSFGGWDTHSGNFKRLRTQLPDLDRGLATMIGDLHARGMGDDVVTLAWGEFGRTPKINREAGRDHWSPVMSALVAGGGLRMGQAVGSSSARGEYPKDRPYKVPHVLATVYHALGIDPGQTFPSGTGRPMYLLDERDVVEELV